MKERPDIYRERGDDGISYVIVIDKKGREIFRKPYSPQIRDLAFTIYMGEEYGDRIQAT